MCTNQELQVVTQAVVTSVLDELADKIYKVLLYGSYARGDFTSESDIDIMMIERAWDSDTDLFSDSFRFHIYFPPFCERHRWGYETRWLTFAF